MKAFEASRIHADASISEITDMTPEARVLQQVKTATSKDRYQAGQKLQAHRQLYLYCSTATAQLLRTALKLGADSPIVINGAIVVGTAARTGEGFVRSFSAPKVRN